MERETPMRRRTGAEKRHYIEVRSRQEGKTLQMAAGAFRIADDFPAIAKRQRIIQTTDENPLFTVDVADMAKDAEAYPIVAPFVGDSEHLADAIAYVMTPAELGKMLAPNGVPPIKVLGMDLAKEKGPLDGYKQWWLARTGAEPPKPTDARGLIITDELREQMRNDRRDYDALRQRCRPEEHLSLKVAIAVRTAHQNSPKCLGVDVVLDTRSYHSLVEHLIDIGAWHRANAKDGVVFMGARIMMYDCCETLIEARPRWK